MDDDALLAAIVADVDAGSSTPDDFAALCASYGLNPMDVRSKAHAAGVDPGEWLDVYVRTRMLRRDCQAIGLTDPDHYVVRVFLHSGDNDKVWLKCKCGKPPMSTTIAQFMRPDTAKTFFFRLAGTVLDVSNAATADPKWKDVVKRWLESAETITPEDIRTSTDDNPYGDALEELETFLNDCEVYTTGSASWQILNFTAGDKVIGAQLGSGTLLVSPPVVWKQGDLYVHKHTYAIWTNLVMHKTAGIDDERAKRTLKFAGCVSEKVSIYGAERVQTPSLWRIPRELVSRSNLHRPSEAVESEQKMRQMATFLRNDTY